MRQRHAGSRATGVRGALAAVVSLLTLPGIAAASHLDGFVFTFEQGNQAPEYWCATPGLGACFLGGSTLTQFDSSSWSGRCLGAFGEESVYLTGMDYLGATAIYTNRA